jgi:hypothetical protein
VSAKTSAKKEFMKRMLPIISGLVIAATLSGSPPASAEMRVPALPGVAEEANALMQKADWDDWRYRRRYDYYRYDRRYDRDRYDDRCRYRRHECAAQWGWGTWAYRRCLWRHGC